MPLREGELVAQLGGEALLQLAGARGNTP